MSASITPIDKYTLRCFKPLWSEDDIFLAECLGIREDNGDYYPDVRTISKKALSYYFKEVFPTLMYSGGSEAYRVALFNNIKDMYANVYNEFMENYYPLAGYKEQLGKDLRQHQKDTLSAIINRRVNLLALDMGTGKTLTAATLSKITRARRTIVIAPALAKWNWFVDMTRHWGYNPMYWTILDSKKSKSIKAFRERFVVLNYEQVAKQMDYLLSDEINHIIIDECHYLKNPKSARAKAVAELIQKAGKNVRITMLTGTPVTNRVNDMYAYLKIAEHPLGKNYERFKRLYTISASVRGEKIIGAQNIPDLKGKVSNLMIRLRSEDCLDLPDLIIKNYYMEAEDLSNEYQEELKNLRDKKDRYDSLHGKDKQKMSFEIKDNIHTLNRLVATSKVKKVKELIDSLIEEGEKVIVFSGYKDPLRLLEEKFGRSCVKIDGSVDPHKRQLLIDRFIDDPKCTVFLGNMKAAGIAINLVNARHVIFMNMPFTPDLIEQAQKRAHRSGQQRNVFVYYTIAMGTIDEHIYSLVADKAEDINELVDGDHSGVINYKNIAGELFRRLLEETTTV